MSVVSSALQKFLTKELEADKRDAAYELYDLVQSENGKHRSDFGEALETIFQVISSENDVSIVQTFIDIITEVVTIHQPNEDQLSTNSGGRTTLQQIQQSTSTLFNSANGQDKNSFDWLQIPLKYTDAILNDKEGKFGKLIEALVPKNRTMVRVDAIILLRTLWDNRKTEMEAALGSIPMGMQTLVDMLDDDREEVRYEMLILILQLTESNQELQTFLAFSDGFTRLFQIIKEEMNMDVMVLDCLTIMCNMLLSNQTTQKMFLIQPQVFEHMQQILALPLGEDMSSRRRHSSLSPDPQLNHANNSQIEMDQAPTYTMVDVSRCTNEKRKCLFLGLEIMSCIVRGTCPDQIYDEYCTYYTYDRNMEEHNHTSDELKKLRENTLRDMQSQVGASSHAMKAVVDLILSLPYDDEIVQEQTENEAEAEIKTFSDIRIQALTLLGDLVCENPENAMALSMIEVELPINSAVLDADVFRTIRPESIDDISLVSPQRIDESEYTILRINAITGIMRLALCAEEYEDRMAANYFCACLLYNNPSMQISIIGHAITPPPQNFNDRNPNNPSQIKHGEAAGRFIIDVFLASSYAAKLAATASNSNRGNIKERFLDGTPRSDDSDMEENESDLAHIYEINWCAGRIIGMLLKSNSACKDMALRIPVNHDGEDTTFLPCFLLSLADIATAYSTHGSINMDNATKSMLKIVLICQLKVLVEWMKGCSRAAAELAATPTSLFLFNFSNGIAITQQDESTKTKTSTVGQTDVDTEGLAALALGQCLVSLGLQEYSKRDMEPQLELRARLMRSLFKVIGVEKYTNKLLRLQRSHGFKVARRSKRALIRENVAHSIEDDCYYEKEFIDEFEKDQKDIQQDIIDFYTDTGGGTGTATPSKNPDQPGLNDFASLKKNHDSLVEVGEQYKEIIRMQDKRYAELQAKNQQLENKISENAAINNQGTNDNDSNEYVDHLKDALHQSENRIRELENHVSSLKNQIENDKQHRKLMADENTELETIKKKCLVEGETRIKELENKVLELENKLCERNELHKRTLDRCSEPHDEDEDEDHHQVLESEENKKIKHAYNKLLEEHTDLLVLVTNQELSKCKLLEIIRTGGGEEAFDRAQVELGHNLIQAFEQSQ